MRRMLWKGRKGTMKMGVRVDQQKLQIGGRNGGTNFEWNMKSCEDTFEVRSCAWNLRWIWCDATTRPTRFHDASWTCQWQWIKINITFQADISRAMIDGVDGEKEEREFHVHEHACAHHKTIFMSRWPDKSEARKLTQRHVPTQEGWLDARNIGRTVESTRITAIFVWRPRGD
jgi:hypothetical protein